MKSKKGTAKKRQRKVLLLKSLLVFALVVMFFYGNITVWAGELEHPNDYLDEDGVITGCRDIRLVAKNPSGDYIELDHILHLEAVIHPGWGAHEWSGSPEGYDVEKQGDSTKYRLVGGEAFGIRKSGGSVDVVTIVDFDDWFLYTGRHWMFGDNVGGLSLKDKPLYGGSALTAYFGSDDYPHSELWAAVPENWINQIPPDLFIPYQGDDKKVLRKTTAGDYKEKGDRIAHTWKGGRSARPCYFFETLDPKALVGAGGAGLLPGDWVKEIVEYEQSLFAPLAVLNYCLQEDYPPATTDALTFALMNEPATLGTLENRFSVLKDKLSDPRTTEAFVKWVFDDNTDSELKGIVREAQGLTPEAFKDWTALPDEDGQKFLRAYADFIRYHWTDESLGGIADENTRKAADAIIPLFITGHYSYALDSGAPAVWTCFLSKNFAAGREIVQFVTPAPGQFIEIVTADGERISNFPVLVPNVVDAARIEENVTTATVLYEKGVKAQQWLSFVAGNFETMAGGFNLTRWIADFFYNVANAVYSTATRLTQTIIQNGSVWITAELQKSHEIVINTTPEGAYVLANNTDTSVIKYIFRVMLMLTFSLFALVIMVLGITAVKDAVLGGGNLQLKQYLPRLIFFSVLLALSQYFFLFMLYINNALVNVWFGIPLFNTRAGATTLPRNMSLALLIWICILAIGVFLLVVVLWALYIYRSAILCILFILTPAALLAGILPSTQRYFNFWLWTSIETIFIQFLHALIFCVFLGVWITFHQSQGQGMQGFFSDPGDMNKSFFNTVSEELLLACILLLTITLPPRVFGSAIGARSFIGGMIAGQLISGAKHGVGGLLRAPSGAFKGGARALFSKDGKAEPPSGGVGPSGEGRLSPTADGGGPGVGGGSSSGAQALPGKKAYSDQNNTVAAPLESPGTIQLADRHGRPAGEYVVPPQQNAMGEALKSGWGMRERKEVGLQPPSRGRVAVERARRATGRAAFKGVQATDWVLTAPFKFTGGAVSGATAGIPGLRTVGGFAGRVISRAPYAPGKMLNRFWGQNVASSRSTKPPQ